MWRVQRLLSFAPAYRPISGFQVHCGYVSAHSKSKSDINLQHHLCEGAYRHIRSEVMCSISEQQTGEAAAMYIQAVFHTVSKSSARQSPVTTASNTHTSAQTPR
jgi:hypothetical protein